MNIKVCLLPDGGDPAPRNQGDNKG